MSLNPYDEARALMEAYPTLIGTEYPAQPSTIDKAEKLLDATFPSSYRLFLATYGILSFRSEEIAGLFGDSDPEGLAWPSVVFSTRSMRAHARWTTNDGEEIPFPKQFVQIYDLGDGSEFCLDTSALNDVGECPVVAMHGGKPFKRPEDYHVAPDFGTFLLNLVRGILTEDTL